MTAFAGIARLLVVLHAAAAIALIGAATHHAIIAWRELRGKPLRRLRRIYAWVTAGAYGVTFAFGLLAYPTFRYEVRGLYLDKFAPWASNLFDTKENFAALGLPLVAIVLATCRDDDRRWYHAACVWLIAAIVWFDVFSGLVITMARGV